jgi:hypothetical protein
VPEAGDRYIAGHDVDDRHCHAPPPPLSQTGAHLTAIVPPETNSVARFSPECGCGLCPDPAVL